MTLHPLKLDRVQTGVRMERRLVKVLKAVAELRDVSLGALLETMVFVRRPGERCKLAPRALQINFTVESLVNDSVGVVHADQRTRLVPRTIFAVSPIRLIEMRVTAGRRPHGLPAQRPRSVAAQGWPAHPARAAGRNTSRTIITRVGQARAWNALGTLPPPELPNGTCPLSATRRRSCCQGRSVTEAIPADRRLDSPPGRDRARQARRRPAGDPPSPHPAFSATPPEESQPSSFAPEAPSAITPGDISRELRDFARRQERRRRVIPRAFLVGILAGLTASAFHLTLNAADRLRDGLFHIAHALRAPLGLPLAAAVCGGAASAALWLVRRFAPETAGSGIPHLKAVLHRLRGMSWQRVLLVKFASGTLAIGGGLALGREGPTVQMGGALGQMVSRWFHGNARERHTLIAAGAGAGLAAAFNAPLAGVIFVLEELRRDFAPGALTGAFVASVTADVVERLLMGQSPVFHVASPPVPPLSSLPLFLVLGLFAGVLGVAFNRTLLASLRLFERTAAWPLGLPAGIVGGAVAVVGWFLPGALGGGGPLVEATLAGRMALGALAGLLLLRFGMTMLSYGCGTAGGIFAPLLVIGAQAGLLCVLVGERFFPAVAGYHTSFAVVGMAALFAAIVRAPLTGIVLLLEMTEQYSLMLPLLAACFTAYAIADLLRDQPIYEALLERDLERGQGRPPQGETTLIELKINAGAPFDGRRVADLGLPAGCLLVTIAHAGIEEVPSRETILRAGDRITAVVAASAAQGIDLLHRGSGALPAGQRHGADPGRSADSIHSPAPESSRSD